MSKKDVKALLAADENQNRQSQYYAKRVATQLNLRRYFNECIPVMAQEEAGEISMDEALVLFDELDVRWGKVIVDDLSPIKSIIVL